MTKRYAIVAGLALSVVLLVSGCRAFNSSYGSSIPADVSELVDYTKDTTVCTTPSEVKVQSNTTNLLDSTGWAHALDSSESVTITATKLNTHSVTMMIQKVTSDKSVDTLSFTVKQTAVDGFAVCNFKYTENKDRPYEHVSGTMLLNPVNVVDAKGNTVTNSGTFDLTFSHSDIGVTKVQRVVLGADVPATPDAAVSGSKLSGGYFINWITETTAK